MAQNAKWTQCTAVKAKLPYCRIKLRLRLESETSSIEKVAIETRAVKKCKYLICNLVKYTVSILEKHFLQLIHFARCVGRGLGKSSRGHHIIGICILVAFVFLFLCRYIWSMFGQVCKLVAGKIKPRTRYQ